MIEKCWDSDPDKRPTARELLSIITNTYPQDKWPLIWDLGSAAYHDLENVVKYLVRNTQTTYQQLLEAMRGAIFGGALTTIAALQELGVNVNNPTYTPLFFAIIAGKEVVLEHLISLGADVNMQVESKTPLMEAAGMGNLGVLLLLIKHGAIVDKRDKIGRTPLWFAARYGKTQEAAALIDHGANVDLKANDGTTALMRAAERGRTETIRELLARRAQVNIRAENGMTALSYAAEAGEPEIVKELISNGALIDSQDKWGQTPLMDATHHGNTDTVRMLLNYAPKLDLQEDLGMTAMHLTVLFEKAQPSIAKALIAQGANLNIQDKKGMTALLCAVGRGHIEIAMDIINNGALLDIQDRHGLTPLHEAANGGHVDLVKHLLDHGAAILEDNTGFTPLHFAAKSGHVEIIKLLVEFGANVKARAEGGRTPLMIAALHHHPYAMDQLVALDPCNEIFTLAGASEADSMGHTAVWYALYALYRRKLGA